MSDTKWTPGPWVIHAKTDTAVVGGRGYVVSACGGHSNNQRDPTELAQELNSNARLIAAAPELYEALENMRCLWHSTCTSHGWDPKHHPFYATSLEVLAKARGDA